MTPDRTVLARRVLDAIALVAEAILRRVRRPVAVAAPALSLVKLRPAATLDSAYLVVRLRRDLTRCDFLDGQAPAVLPRAGDVLLLERALAIAFLKADLFILPLWEVVP